jgi:hypothetical protein
VLHLFNNQVGFDRTTLGFPSVEGCNAIVYQTVQGLCGLHNYGGSSPDQHELRATAFNAFVQQLNIQHMDQSRNLYSVINSTNRYDCRKQDGRQSWVAEMRAFAKGLKFRGTVHLIALTAHLEKGSVYIQYDLNGNGDGCDVSYKKWSKMKEVRVDHTQAPASLKDLKKRVASYDKTTQVAVFRYDVADPNEYSEIVSSVGFAKGSGHLHSATGKDCDNSFRFSFACDHSG